MDFGKSVTRAFFFLPTNQHINPTAARPREQRESFWPTCHRTHIKYNIYECVPLLCDFRLRGRKRGAGVCAQREMDSQRTEEGRRRGGRGVAGVVVVGGAKQDDETQKKEEDDEEMGE